MKLKCRIHEKEYDIVSGATFSEEYNETLDSGSIILDHVRKIPDLKPYDDAYIWNSDEEFNGYYNIGDEVPIGVLGGRIEFNFSTIMGGRRYFVAKESPLSSFELEDEFAMSSFALGIFVSQMFYGLDSQRFRIHKITLKLSLEDPETGAIAIGHYKLPNSVEGGVSKGVFLVLAKDQDYANGENLPETLAIPFRHSLPKSSYTAPPYRAVHLFLGKYAVAETADGGGKSYQIKGIGAPDGSNGVLNYEENTKTLSTLSMAIFGLTSDEILNLKEVSIEGISNCGKTSLRLKETSKNSDGGITLAFEDATPIPMRPPLPSFGFSITVTPGIDRWEGQKNFKITGVDSDASVSYFVDSVSDGEIGDPKTVVSSHDQQKLPKFFKHFLIDSFNCEMVDLGEEIGSADNYKYKISLMSETKRLEKVMLPNISITQPISGKKRSIWYYLNQYVNLYSPKIKIASSNGRWEYANKYKIDQREAGDYGIGNEYLGIPVHEIFDDNTFAPELSLNAPSLKDVLSRLMIVKDCIPVVKNDVIYAMRISETHGEFQVMDGKFSFISEKMSSADYSTSFRREYGGAISQKNSAHIVEYIGFRNKENALMTLENMYLETRFPIYKVNSLCMCYYKSVTVRNTDTNEKYQKLVLVKQDISKLVLQNAVRDALPADWTKFQSKSWESLTIDEMSKHRILTLGYDIGSTRITGWGEEYNYLSDLLGWTREKRTYIETILTMIDRQNPFGSIQYQFLEANEELEQLGELGWRNTMVSPSDPSNITNKLKTVFFQMDYTGMYSGAIVHSKENTESDDIQTSDNCSSSLSILEVDGLYEKEKANRIGNNEVGLIARYDSVDEMNAKYNNVLGSVYGGDVVIFHREYQIYDDCVLANFSGTKDYVLKNYFTTVFAKYRTYSYASYNESVNRAENDKYTVVLSDDSCAFENDAMGNRSIGVRNILSAFSESIIGADLNIYFPNQINGGYFSFDDGKEEYFSDVNQFVSGYSLCFNIKTFGSITNGNFISTVNCYDDGGVYIGSQQEWYKMPVAENDGFLEKIGCHFAHFDDGESIPNNVVWDPTPQNVEKLYNEIFALPLKKREPTFSFGKEYAFCKDDKEVIDFTLQYEIANKDKDLLFSEWMMKLTDFNNYPKFSTEVRVLDRRSQSSPINVYFASEFVNWNAIVFINGNSGNTYKRKILIKVREEASGILKDGLVLRDCSTTVPYSSTFTVASESGNYWSTVKVSIKLDEITKVVKTGDSITELMVRAVYTKERSTTGALISPSETSASTTTLRFGAKSGEEGWMEFYYEGQDAPGLDWAEQVTIDNGRGMENADASYGGFVSEPNYFVFPRTMFIIASEEEMDRQLVYAQYKPGDLPTHMKVIETSPKGSVGGISFDDVFSIAEDESGRPCIQFKANEAIGDSYKSVQYWYYDYDGDGYLHFVFGVNRTRGQGDAKAYVSIVKSINKTVYDSTRRAIGTVMNFAKEENAKHYGKQLYEVIENEL